VSKSPGIVTVITSRDIERTGARDLVDVLRMVPGLEVELDMGGLLGFGMRGIYASEGKVLLLIDGIEFNEDIYGAFNVGHRIPVAMIDRVEVIRGPGSAMYGGYAELGVISVHLKKPTQENEVMVHSGAGVMFDDRNATLGRALGTAYYGASRRHVRFALSASGDFGHMSNRTARDLYGETWDMSNERVASLFLHGNLNLYGLDVRVVVNRYDLESEYPSYEFIDYSTGHYSYLASVKYDWKLNAKLTITPRFQVKIQQPWHTPRLYTPEGERFPDWEYDLLSQKYTGELNVNWQLLDELALSGGLAYDHLFGKEYMGWGYFAGKTSAHYNNVAIYLQGLATTRIVDFALGARFNYHDKAGPSFVPRLAITKEFPRYVHLKLLAAMAYKAPTMLNLGENPDINPEKTQTLEMELGLRAKKWASMTVNLFATRLHDAIVYTLVDDLDDTYVNQRGLSTAGLETTGKLKAQWIELDASWSMYHALRNRIDDYRVPGDDNRTLGFARHRLYSALSINPFGEFFVTPSLTYLSRRWAIVSVYTDANGEDNFIYQKTDPEFLLDVTILHRNVFMDGLTLSLSAHNILNEHAVYVEPYQGYEGFIPGPGLEVMCRLTLDNF
jgi:outer membrane cobalamin receptor